MTLTLAVALLFGAGSAWADVKFLADGALQNARGGWDLPAQGTCTADLTKTTKPDCSALRIVAASSAACTTALGSWVTSGVCNDLVNTTQAACQAAPDRLWNASTGVCAIVMKGDDRNAVECMAHSGTWVLTGTCTGNWVMPAVTAYTPNLVTSNSPGDQCLRCHNKVTQYNGARVRDTDDTRYMGHKNMSRPVKSGGLAWGGPPFSCTGHPGDTDEEACAKDGGTWDPTIYPTDDTGNAINWSAGTIHVGATDYALKWIYGDWLAALPRAIYTDPSLNNLTYSCGRCHTTGWTSDAGTTPKATKEPETTFPGITWNGTGTKNQVNLKGGVAGDSNNMSSWDVWGISCTRCHSSAVDTTSHGGVAPFTAPAGMSSHHTNLTSADFPGWCSNSSFRDQPTCVAGAATWFSGYCTDTRFLGGSAMTAAAAKTACETAGGTNAPAAPGVPLGTWITPCSDNNFVTAATCVAPATWNLPVSSCSVAGLCNDPAMTTAGTCTGTVASGPLAGLARQWQPTSDIVTCIDAGGKWTGSLPQRGQIITALCMQCHRQETSGLPNTNGSCALAGVPDLTKTTPGACVVAGKTWTETGGGLPMQVGPYHSTVTFPSHPHSYQFLNSPHGKFTGKFGDVATAKLFSGYGSFFQTESEAANTGAGCTTCHEVHTSTVAGEKPFRAECTECHKKNLNLIQHPSGVGTPLEEMATKPAEACVSCHMPDGKHLFRINVDKNYSMLPMPAAITANVAPNATPDGAVWVDLDSACGKCHGGGTSNPATTGGISAASAVLTVASSTGFLPNEKIRIVGAGAFYYDDIGHSGKNTDFDTYIKSVDSATQITLAGVATKTVSGAAVVQNAVSNNAAWFSKATLAGYAKGIHNDKPTALFTAAYGVDGSTVVGDASASNCSGSNANCNAYDWDWGDGTTPHGTGVTSTHTYALPGTYTITLSVTQFGFAPASATRKFTAYASDNAPTAGGACSFTGTTWVATCTNSSSDDKGLSLLSINWGDGTMLTNVTVFPAPGPFTHSYLVPGTYKITFKAIDTNGQQNRNSGVITPTGNPIVAASFQYFSISGTVFKPGALPLGAAQIQVKKGGVLVKSAMSAADGTYSTGAMKPGTYTLTVSKTGFTFAASTLTVTTPGNATNQNFTAN